jgi:Tat protein secretion system quality control protein TatD with DNase activity
LVGGVVVYCDPKTWPVVPVRLKAVGLHLKKSLQLRDAEAAQLTKLLGHPSVTALGEVGLDLSEGTAVKLAQLESLGWVFSLAPARVPIILHLRGAPVDPTGDEVHKLALGIMEKREVSPQRRVHSFTGGSDLVDRWESRYPNVFFGLSLAVRGFSAKQKAGVKALPPNKLLLESDSPYFPPPGARHGDPQYLYEVAALVGEIRGCSPEEVIGQSVRNGCRLYGVRWLCPSRI